MDEEMNSEATEGQDEKILRYMEMEKKVHPWADEETLRKMVEDELGIDPSFYEEEAEEGYGSEEGHKEPEELGAQEGSEDSSKGKYKTPALRIILR